MRRGELRLAQRPRVIRGHLVRFDQTFRPDTGDPLGEPARQRPQRRCLRLQLRLKRGGVVVAGVGGDEPVEIRGDQPEVVLQFVGLVDDLLEGGEHLLVELDGVAPADIVLVVQRGQPDDARANALVRVRELTRVETWVEGRQVPARQCLFDDGHAAMVYS